MIQRIQSIYMILAFILGVVTILFLSLGKDIEGSEVLVKDLINNKGVLLTVPVAFGLSSLLAFVSILYYKNRKQQMMFNRLNLILNLYLLGIFVYQLLSLPGEQFVSEKGIGLFVPVVMIVLFFLANKAIQKDEALVKSVDRLR